MYLLWLYQVAPNTSQRKAMLIFMCIPVGPGKSRLIFVSLRNFAVSIDRIIPRWIFHVGQNLILDSDLYLLHIEVKTIIYSAHFLNFSKYRSYFNNGWVIPLQCSVLQLVDNIWKYWMVQKFRELLSIWWNELQSLPSLYVMAIALVYLKRKEKHFMNEPF